MGYKEFMIELLLHKDKLTIQAYKTLAGQAKHGDIKGAEKGLGRLLKRGIQDEKQKDGARNGKPLRQGQRKDCD